MSFLEDLGPEINNVSIKVVTFIYNHGGRSYVVNMTGYMHVGTDGGSEGVVVCVGDGAEAASGGDHLELRDHLFFSCTFVNNVIGRENPSPILIFLVVNDMSHIRLRPSEARWVINPPINEESLAGGLQYLTFTRPDISYAVQHIFLYMHDPREPHLTALKRILRYIRGTRDFGFHLYSSTTISLVGYTDADWAGCPSTRRSTSGYCVFFEDNLLSWSSKRQQTISRSSAEAEYRGVANVVAKTAWLRNLLRELHSPLSAATLVYCDNVSATYLSANPVQHQRTKHIEIDIHFVRDLVTAGQVRVLHLSSRYQYADIFTKGLPSALFKDFRCSLSVRLPPARTAGAY
uniref:Ribonuclease H-like domain-containing protein n=1 Tax=Tanacetum cinerariifolium TaxID=118510 RepID=A0A6L2M2W1_TANCI|nr:ribonuclease H-like domain-containing protein [Tanacetum cinerariifolium]